MIKVLSACGGVLALATAFAAGVVDESYFWTKIVPDANYRMYLAGEDAVLCYAARAAPKEFFYSSAPTKHSP